MDPKEKNNSDTVNHDKVTSRKRKAETVVNSINNDNIYSFCNPSVEEKNESQNSPPVKRAKTSLTKQSKKTSPARDHGDDHDQLEQKQNGQSSNFVVVNRGGQDNSTAPKTIVKTKKKSAVRSLRGSNQDIDVDNSGHEQYQTTCYQKTGKIGPTYSTTVKKPKTPLGKKRKTCSPLGEEGGERGQLAQKKDGQSSSFKVVNRSGRDNSTAAKTTAKTKKKSAVRSLRDSDHDMDVDNSSHEQYQTTLNQKTGKSGPKYSTTVKEPEKPLGKNPKTCSPLGEEGGDRGQLAQKQDGQSSSSKVVNRIRQDNSTAAKTTVKTKKKSAVGSVRNSDHETDVDTLGHECHKVIRTSKKSSFVIIYGTKERQEADAERLQLIESLLSTDRGVKKNITQKRDVKRTVGTKQPNRSQVSDEKREDDYVYRLLRLNESYKRGLFPKDINSPRTVKEHVESGSSLKSKFISCCKTINGIKKIAKHAYPPEASRTVVRINVTKLNSYENVEMIYLTNPTTRQKHLHASPKACKFAAMYEEVILEPKTHVPADCVEKIGTVQNQKFLVS